MMVRVGRGFFGQDGRDFFWINRLGVGGHAWDRRGTFGGVGTD
jgi:hypothetical protein